MKEGTKLERFNSFILSLSSLEHLTDLSLNEVDVNLRPTLLSLIGRASPFLSRLVVTSVNPSSVKKEDILALLIGERAFEMIGKSSEETDSEPEWLQDAQFARLELPSTSLTPICFTLKELCFDSSGVLSASAGVFILRHLPLLQKLSIPWMNTSMAVKIFYDQFRFQGTKVSLIVAF